MNKADYANSTFVGVFWTYAAYYLGKFAVFGSTIILARIISKSDFGVVSFALIVIGFLETINRAGISSALIYYQASPEASNSAFWLDVFIGVVMFILVWILAPITKFYFDDSRIVFITRALAFVFILSSLEDVPKSILSRNLKFNVKFIPDVIQSIIKGGVSIVGALLGFGAWSLVIGHISGAASSLVAYWLIVPWRPAFFMARDWLYKIFSYGSGIVMTDLFSYFLTNIDYLFVGYYLGAIALGVYSIAFRIPELLIIQFCSLVGKVVFPVFAKMKDDHELLRDAFLKTVNYVAIVTIPLSLGLVVIAKPFVITVFSEKWLDAYPVLRAISIYSLFLSLAYNATHAYKARGAVSLMTSLSLFRALMLVPSLWWVSSRVGTLEAIGWVHALIAFIGGTLNITVAAKVLEIPFKKVFQSMQAPFASGVLMVVGVQGTLLVTENITPWLQLAICVILGGVIYSSLLYWLQKEVATELIYMTRTLIFSRLEKSHKGN